jgi:hypothetical protein
MIDRCATALKALVFAVFLSLGIGTAHAQLVLSSNATTFRAGETIRIHLSFANPGPGFNADFYFGVIHPDAVTMNLITNFSPLTAVVTTIDAEPEVYQPLASDVALPSGINIARNDFFVYTLSGEPPGRYAFFAFLTSPRSQVGGQVGETELLAFAVWGIEILP